MIADRLLTYDVVPDGALRAAIRLNCRRRLALERRRGESVEEFARRSRGGPIALVPDRPNEQHYELPPEFFELCLGPRLKYSACYWPAGVESLAAAEDAMLELTCERAGIEDGMEVLDLGCGWGSLSFWLRERYPNTRVLAVSNSALQREFIEARAQSTGVDGLDVVTADMNEFDTERRFDRVLSVEMFEHMRNYEALMAKVATWLRPDGRLFVHVFSHGRHAYTFEDSWMAKTFFTGGTMPSHDLLPHFQRDLGLLDSWRLPGWHYQRTSESWLERLDENTDAARRVLAVAYGETEADAWLARWRVFFMACAELFGYREGGEWLVSHYLFAPRSPST